MYRGADATRAAAFRAAFAPLAKGKPRQSKYRSSVVYDPSMKPPDMAPSSCCPANVAKDGIPCKHIRQAAARGHLSCVEHFWDLRSSEGNPNEEYFEKQAFLAALIKKDFAILEYLLYRGCPWDPFLADRFFCSRPTTPWEEWHDLYDIAFNNKLFSPCVTEDLLLKFMVEGHWDFLEKVHKYGHTFEEVKTRRLAFGPDGANTAVLRELHKRKEFRTADLSWLTPGYAVKVNDLALLKFACELRPDLVVSAMAKVENPVLREWLGNHLNTRKTYPKARLV